MTKKDILEAVRTLSFSQGFYGRLYNHLCEDDDALQALEDEGFNDAVDLVMYLEG